MDRPGSLPRRGFLVAMGGTAALAAAGCSFGSSKSKGQGQVLRLTLTSPLDSLDPQFVNGSNAFAPAALLEGLVNVNSSGSGVVPATAEKWTVSGDGKTYTFTIRHGAKYSNGDPISARDFEWTYKRLLTPTGASSAGTTGANTYKPGLGIRNAVPFQSGAVSDWTQVGIHAQDDKTLVITLDAPNPDFLIGMADTSMVLLNPINVQKHANKAWQKPANWVGNGPFVLTAWSPNTSAKVKANPNYWDKDNVLLAGIDVAITADSNAQLLAYKNGETDVIPVTLSQLGGDNTLASQVQSAKGYALQYLQSMWSKHPASRDVRVRKALALAIDRSKLAEVMPDAEPIGSLVPKEAPGWDSSLQQPFDLDQAKSLLAEAGFPNGKGMPKIQLYVSHSQPTIEALADMWQSGLGVTVKENVVDVGVWSANRWKEIPDANTMGFYSSAFGGYTTINNWVYSLYGPAYEAKFTLPYDKWVRYQAIQADTKLSGADKAQQAASLLSRYESPEVKQFAALASQAHLATGDGDRRGLFIQATQALQDLYLTIPLYWYPHEYLVKPVVHDLHVLPEFWSFYLKGVSIKK